MSDQSRRMKDKTAVDLVFKKGCGDSISGGRVDYCDELRDYTELGMLVVDNGRFRLPRVEHQVTAMLAHGFSDKIIAQHLGLSSVKYVQNAIFRAVRRNRLRDRGHLARAYSDLGGEYLLKKGGDA